MCPLKQTHSQILSAPYTSCPALVATSLESQHGFSHVPLGSAQAVTNYKLLCSPSKVALGQTQAVTNLGMHQSPSQEAQEPIHLVAGIIPQQSITQFTLQMKQPNPC